MALAYDRTGSGPPLVLLHPLGADRRVWDPVTDRLAEQRDVLALDLPGFGESPAVGERPPTPRALAAEIAAQLAQLGVDRPHVAGNSLGGWVALELGRTGAARTVTAIAPAGLWPEPLVPKQAIARQLARRMLPLVGHAAATGAGRRLLLHSSVAHPRRVPAAAAAHLVRAYATAQDFTAVNDAMRAGRFEALERIRCPVTLVWPDHDRLIQRPMWIPDRVHNVVLTDSGHIPMWDAPGALADVLLQASADSPAGDGGASSPPAARLSSAPAPPR